MGPELQHLAGRVWLWPHDEDPALIQGSVAVIADGAGSVLVDAGNSPAVATRIRSAIAFDHSALGNGGPLQTPP